mmetsp:Transcript_9194/g.20485  ORF Transcript_9194/g.20485 Transcript_9194/m.20485 type:complete len:187 (-) Transcript_9194:292-852(-)
MASEGPSTWHEAVVQLKGLDDEIRALQEALELKTQQRALLAKREQALREEHESIMRPEAHERLTSSLRERLDVSESRQAAAVQYAISTSFSAEDSERAQIAISCDGGEAEDFENVTDNHSSELDLADMLEVVGLARCGLCGHKMPIDDPQAITAHSLRCEAEMQQRKLLGIASTGVGPYPLSGVSA